MLTNLPCAPAHRLIIALDGLNIEQAKTNCLKAGWAKEQFETNSYEEALKNQKTFLFGLY